MKNFAASEDKKKYAAPINSTPMKVSDNPGLFAALNLLEDAVDRNVKIASDVSSFILRGHPSNDLEAGDEKDTEIGPAKRILFLAKRLEHAIDALHHTRTELERA